MSQVQLYPDLDVYRYTVKQAAELARVSPKTIANHRSRGTLAIGRAHWSGRVLFNMVDVVRVAFTARLTDNLAIAVGEAASIAEAIIPSVRGHKWPVDVLLMERLPDGAWQAGSLNQVGDNPSGLRDRPHFRFPAAAIVDHIHARAGISPIVIPTFNPFEKE